jgi:hypothetical protein
MPDRLDNGHVLTDEDVDTAQLIKQLNDRLGRPTDHVTLRIAATPRACVRQVLAEQTSSEGFADQLDGLLDNGQVLIVSESVAEALRSEDADGQR